MRAPAKPRTRIVHEKIETLERRRTAEFRDRLHVDRAKLRIVQAGCEVFMAGAARMLARRSAPVRMVGIRGVRKVRRLHAHERRLQALRLEDLEPRAKRRKVARGVVLRNVLFKFGRHDKLEERRTVHRPVRIRIRSPVLVPLPQGRLNLASAQMRRANLFCECRELPIFAQIARRRFNREPRRSRRRKGRSDCGRSHCNAPKPLVHVLRPRLQSGSSPDDQPEPGRPNRRIERTGFAVVFQRHV